MYMWHGMLIGGEHTHTHTHRPEIFLFNNIYVVDADYILHVHISLFCNNGINSLFYT